MIEAKAENALEIGRAAEHLVVADLLLSGYRAFLTEQGMPYDVVIDHDGKIIRVQVKATAKTKNVSARSRSDRVMYSWNVRSRGKNRVGVRLDESHCDIVALVALDARHIAYLPIAVCGQTVQFFPNGSEVSRGGHNWGRNVDQFPIAEALSGNLSGYRSSDRPLTHCPHGHEYTAENLRITKSGSPTCIECSRKQSREYMRLKRTTKFNPPALEVAA